MSEGASQGPVIGIDVAKAELEVAVRPSGDWWTATNQAGGIRELVARLTTLGPELIVLEATGGYELAVVGVPLHPEIPSATWFRLSRRNELEQATHDLAQAPCESAASRTSELQAR